jgi:hypothetical protein
MVVGLVLGPITVWALINVLPVQSGRSAVTIAAAVTIASAVGAAATGPAFGHDVAT